MRSPFVQFATVCTLLVLICGVVSAQQSKEPLKATMTANKIVVREGVETKQSADTVKPGDIVEYSVEYRNQSARTLRDVRGVLPIPVGMSFESGSAMPKEFWASTDGRNFSAAPLKRRQKNSDGSETEVPVPLEQYRSLRWELGEIAGNSTKNVRARVRVLPTAPATVPTKH